jgi:hypothetical protein
MVGWLAGWLVGWLFSWKQRFESWYYFSLQVERG